MNSWECTWFVHWLCFCHSAVSHPFFFPPLPTAAKHVVNTLFSETGMFFPAIDSVWFRRGQLCQCALCCKPPCQNTPVPFWGQEWWLWAAFPSLGGCSLSAVAFPFNLYFLPSSHENALYTFCLFTQPDSYLGVIHIFVAAFKSLITLAFFGEVFGNRLKEIKITQKSFLEADCMRVCV